MAESIRCNNRDDCVSQAAKRIEPAIGKPMSQRTKALFNRLLESLGEANVALAKRAKFAHNLSKCDLPEIVDRERWSKPKMRLQSSLPCCAVAGAWRPVWQACSLRGRAFRAIVSGEASPGFQSLEAGVAHNSAFALRLDPFLVA